MAVTQGKAGRINAIGGISTIVRFSNADAATNKDVIFPAGLILANTESGLVYIADGTSKLSELEPRIDKLLNKAEKDALAKAFVDGGSYAAAAGGVVVHDADGKIADVELHVVENGKIVESYLSDYIEGGKVKLDALPDSVRAGFSFFADYAALQDATAEQKKGFMFVADASGDATVDAGWALYVFTGEAFTKVAEGEGLDIAADMFVSAENVEKVGAVMYSHTLQIEAPTMAELVTLTNAANA